MECTQRLECTQQEFFQNERECPEQIGFLGICGNKYPVKKGPNKIGRDSNTCNIVLNLNSVSRQHAVINVLNSTEFMLMDLDSANKTKLLGKTLLPYMPQPLKNGDMVQFGEIFGMFRLLEEQNDLLMTQALPMTQQIYIPDTPIPTRHMSKLNSATTIPESPDVSDKDDSFIIASQPKGHTFKSSNTHYIKPGKTISIQPIGGNKVDNVYWNSSKKSTSLNLDDSTSSLNESISLPCVKLNEKENEANAGNIHEIETQAFPQIGTVSIHEMETQPYPLKVKEIDSIYEANTQLPGSPIVDSIYTADTQLPSSSIASPSIKSAKTQITDKSHSPSIYSQETQVLPGESLPVVRKINKQQNMQFDLCADKDNSIYTAETQKISESPIRPKSNSGSPFSRKPEKNSKFDVDDVVLFDEIDGQPDDENFESQAILTEDILLPINKYIEVESEPLSQIALPKSSKRNMRIQSDSSTDCDEIDDDILPTQRIPEKERKVNDGDLTDCEDEMIELKIDQKPDNTAEKLDLEDVATQVIEVLETPSENEDILTQVIDIVERNDSEKPDFEDLPTQVIVEVGVPVKQSARAPPISDEVEFSPFKIPLKSALKAKKKDGSRTPKIKGFANIERQVNVDSEQNDDDKYYKATQDIIFDLCSQTDSTPESQSKSLSGKGNKSSLQSDISLSSSDGDEKIDNLVSTLSSQDIRDVIGVEKVAPVKRVSSLGSDASDLELTPKKVRPFKFMDIDLPNSQEIKTSVSLSTKSVVTESSSESESEQNSEDQCTPILFHKKKKVKHDVKMDLTKKFDVESLPTRVITRVRKPTSKVQQNESKTMGQNILKPKFLTEQDDDVDREIITENITRLKSKNDKSKNARDVSKVNKLDESKNKDVTRQLHETKKTKIQDKCIVPDEHQDIKKENKKQIKTVDDKTEKPVPKSEEIPKEDIAMQRESKRKKKSSSPVEDNKDNIDHVVTVTTPPQSNAIDKPVEIVDISKEMDNKTNETKELKRNTKTSAPKLKEEKSRGPIMIEPHTITVPVKEEKPKKREYKRKNKEPATITVNKLENHNFTLETKSETIKVENVDEPKRPIRSTRARKKQSEDSKPTTEVLVDSEKLKRTTKPKEASPEKEVRRSKRQRTVKAKEEKEPTVKSILKTSTTHDQSTIYNLSGLGSESPKNMKRACEFEAPAPLPKRTRSVANASLRATPARTQKTCYVLFTAFPYEEVKSKLEKLGAVVVTDVMQCTVLLTLQIRRTFKLLCAVGLGKPIVGPNWVQACADTNMIVDPWLYIIKDLAAETRFRFNLERTLSGRRNFLEGYHVSSTPGVMPQASEMKLIVQCSGGTWQEGGPRWLCLSNAADKALWPELRKRGAILVTTELILGGVLQQRLDIEANAIKIQ